MKPQNLNSLIESLKELNNAIESLISKLHLEAAKVGYIFVRNKGSFTPGLFPKRFKIEKRDIQYLKLLNSLNDHQN